ncbi:hypothetical protein WJX72_003742 [[Myrmecia] bisecta]|uniref:Uncharacterized protein n=1 Tax=[Myrmecia] bisecta TaxID=41462 RepID=A0AAW1PPK6_9CHLO
MSGVTQRCVKRLLDPDFKSAIFTPARAIKWGVHACRYGLPDVRDAFVEYAATQMGSLQSLELLEELDKPTLVCLMAKNYDHLQLRNKIYGAHLTPRLELAKRQAGKTADEAAVMQAMIAAGSS